MPNLPPKPIDALKALTLCENPDTQVKAALALTLTEIVSQRQLSNAEAAKLLEIPTYKLTRILCGEFRGVGTGTLIEYVSALSKEMRGLWVVRYDLPPLAMPFKRSKSGSRLIDFDG